MKEPLPEWGPKERDARKALNCIRLELEPSVAQDLINSVLAAFAELQAEVARLIDLAAEQVPSSWLDPLMSNVDLPAGPTEKLLNAIRANILALKDQHGCEQAGKD